MNGAKMARKNLMVEQKKLTALQKLLESSSESKAVREAIERILAGEKMIAAFERLRQRGTWTDPYGRTCE